MTPIRSACLGLAAAALFWGVGCARQQSAYLEQPGRTSLAAPTAREVESPLQADAGGAAPPDVVIVQHDDPAIPESATVPTRELYGGATFPGVDADMSRGPMTAERARALAQPAQIDPEAQARVQDLEAQVAALQGQDTRASRVPIETEADLQRRLRALELRIAAMEGQAPPAPGSAQEAALSVRLDTMETRLEDLRSLPEDEKAARQARAREPFEARVRELESQLSALEGRTPAPVSGPPAEAVLSLEQQVAQLEEAPPAAVPGTVAEPPALDAPNYLIGSGDVVELYCFDDNTLNTEATVRYDGYVSLPLIPDQQVGDVTRAEAEGMLRTAYGRIFRDPQLSLVVREAASKTFLVMGDVEAPGRYPYERETTLVEAVTLAGGLRRRQMASSTGGFVGVTGQLTKAFVIRTADGERQVYEYDLRHMGRPGAHASEAPVYFGDVVYVPEGVNLVYLLGESRNPVIVELTEGMTMLQMLALSGGFNTSTARLRSVVLLRPVDGESTQVLRMDVREMLKTGRDFPLHPGDIIYIPRKYLVRLQEFVDRMTGSMLPVLDTYVRAVEAYYARDLAQLTLRLNDQNNTLRTLGQIEAFGDTTQSIFQLFGAP